MEEKLYVADPIAVLDPSEGTSPDFLRFSTLSTFSSAWFIISLTGRSNGPSKWLGQPSDDVQATHVEASYRHTEWLRLHRPIRAFKCPHFLLGCLRLAFLLRPGASTRRSPHQPHKRQLRSRRWPKCSCSNNRCKLFSSSPPKRPRHQRDSNRRPPGWRKTDHHL